MKKVTFAFLGMGNRGINYSSKVERFPEEMEVVAIADLRRDRLETANKIFNLPEDRLFNSAEELLAQPKMADILVVASQDQQHREHAIAAMEAGYDLLLEKPIAATLELWQRPQSGWVVVCWCAMCCATPYSIRKSVV